MKGGFSSPYTAVGLTPRLVEDWGKGWGLGSCLLEFGEQTSFISTAGRHNAERNYRRFRP
jgi:hypothetical protein